MDSLSCKLGTAHLRAVFKATGSPGQRTGAAAQTGENKGVTHPLSPPPLHFPRWPPRFTGPHFLRAPRATSRDRLRLTSLGSPREASPSSSSSSSNMQLGCFLLTRTGVFSSALFRCNLKLGRFGAEFEALVGARDDVIPASSSTRRAVRHLHRRRQTPRRFALRRFLKEKACHANQKTWNQSGQDERSRQPDTRKLKHPC